MVEIHRATKRAYDPERGRPLITYRSIFTRSTAAERERNFRTYFEFSRRQSGELIEADKDLATKRERLRAMQNVPIRSRQPLSDPDAFYRNYVSQRDPPGSLDRKTLLLTCIYKFARHEWVGINGAWDAQRSLANSKELTEKISRYHLAEEFCHIRLFHEMFRTMQLDGVEWVPLGPIMQRVYRFFPHLPGFLLDAPAFVTELMGAVFYRHLDRAFDDIFADEPEARERLRALLREIAIDEVAHVGLRRNFLGPVGILYARLLVVPLFRVFFRDIPESRLLFDVDQMIRDGLDFDYGLFASDMVEQSWVPSYCCTGPCSGATGALEPPERPP
jgi:hypothetical protein